jgi:MotA/TolQ/ExbB proton channel family
MGSSWSCLRYCGDALCSWLLALWGETLLISPRAKSEELRLEGTCVRSFVIRHLLPLLLCLLPVAAGLLVVVAVPERAMTFYLESIARSYLDWFILSLGLFFFLLQLLLAWRGLRWQVRGFDERSDPLLQRIYQTADWFPLLGLFGTLVGILQTFARISEQEAVAQREIVSLYAPSLTTAASGLLMAFLNIVPLWLVSVGRGLILSLAAPPQAVTRES